MDHNEIGVGSRSFVAPCLQLGQISGTKDSDFFKNNWQWTPFPIDLVMWWSHSLYSPRVSDLDFSSRVIGHFFLFDCNNRETDREREGNMTNLVVSLNVSVQRSEYSKWIFQPCPQSLFQHSYTCKPLQEHARCPWDSSTKCFSLCVSTNVKQIQITSTGCSSWKLTASDLGGWGAG